MCWICLSKRSTSSGSRTIPWKAFTIPVSCRWGCWLCPVVRTHMSDPSSSGSWSTIVAKMDCSASHCCRPWPMVRPITMGGRSTKVAVWQWNSFLLGLLYHRRGRATCDKVALSRPPATWSGPSLRYSDTASIRTSSYSPNGTERCLSSREATL